MTDAECFWQARRAIYLSGPMSSYPDNNYPLFMKVAAELRQQHHVYNPAEFPWENTFPIRKAFAAYCRYICEEADTIEDVYEPYLLQRGLLQRTPRGRVATPSAFEHLGLTAPSG